MLVPAQDGHWVNEKFARIAEIITDYDPTLQLVWIPPENRVPGGNTPPYAILDTKVNKLVFTIQEDELDHRVLARLFAGDTTKNDVLRNIEADEAARDALKLKEMMEKAEERRDFIATVAGSPLHSFKHNGRIIPC